MRSGTIGFHILFCSAVMVTGRAWGQGNGHAFIAGLDSIRTGLRIPGMSVAVMRGDTILLEEGLGWADWQKRERVRPTTTFRIASITKTFTSTLVMQLVEQDRLDLRSLIGRYGLDLGNPGITVRNLLTHTSEEAPGSWFQYNGYRFGRLGPVVEKVAGVPFHQLLMENIVQPLNMSSTAPGDSLSHYESWLRENPSSIPFFERAHAHLAKPYALDEKGNVVETQYLDEFGAFGGIATTAGDLLKYSAAIDSNRFVSARTKAQIFTPNRTTEGGLTPYGLGWFVQTYRGVSYYWHFGQTQGESGLFVKVPSRKLTLVVLTNTDKLSQPFPLGDGDLFMSPVGQLFYKYY
ncbi:MAG TPA: serine hydrolase domain-containing protein, partial [Puia sp.]|nr:serine hydrolase domain-containing protein [Puia sp.]